MYDERRYYKIYASKYMSGTPFSALAFHFSKKGLNTTLYHEDETLFNNKNALSKDDCDAAMTEYKMFLQKAIESGTKIIKGKKIDSQLIKEEIDRCNLVVAAGEIAGDYHAILISDYDKNQFVVCDPLFKSKQIRTTEEITKFMDTNIGKWFISINNN